MSAVELTAIGGIATATLTMMGSALAALRYLWVRDPAAARNGTLDRLSRSLDKMTDTQSAFIKTVDEHDTRSSERHEKMMRYMERLADTIAPRKPL